jgi:hypothetical protein
MPGAQLRRILASGLGFCAASAISSVQAQQPLQPLAPAPAVQSMPATAPRAASPRVIGQPLVLEPAGPPGAIQPNVLPPPTAAPPSVPSTGACSCGDRHGVSRWLWHKNQCKRRLQECALGFPEEFNEWPLGASLYAHGRTQVANGNAARMVFYHYDFVEGTSQLNVRGRDKLAKMLPLLPATFNPVVVERTPSTPGLDEQRRSGMLAELSGSRFPVPAERIVIGPAPSAGLAGFEAIFIYGNQIGALQSGGAGGVGGYAGSAGLSGGGLSGSAVTSGAGGGIGR